jgi:hypothetical protein
MTTIGLCCDKNDLQPKGGVIFVLEENKIKKTLTTDSLDCNRLSKNILFLAGSSLLFNLLQSSEFSLNLIINRNEIFPILGYFIVQILYCSICFNKL